MFRSWPDYEDRATTLRVLRRLRATGHGVVTGPEPGPACSCSRSGRSPRAPFRGKRTQPYAGRPDRDRADASRSRP